MNPRVSTAPHGGPAATGEHPPADQTRLADWQLPLGFSQPGQLIMDLLHGGQPAEAPATQHPHTSPAPDVGPSSGPPPADAVEPSTRDSLSSHPGSASSPFPTGGLSQAATGDPAARFGGLESTTTTGGADPSHPARLQPNPNVSRQQPEPAQLETTPRDHVAEHVRQETKRRPSRHRRNRPTRKRQPVD